MTHEQFTFWLNGYLQGKETLKSKEINLIQDNIKGLSQPIVIDSVQAVPSYPSNNPWIQPYYYTPIDFNSVTVTTN